MSVWKWVLDGAAGAWFSYYDRVSWTNPADVDIDHMVALAEAWDSVRGPGPTPYAGTSPTTWATTGRWSG